jgi:putative ABC transport system permease protein
VGAQRVVVLSDKLWRNKFGANRDVIGRSISLNGTEHTVVGVAPPALTYPGTPELWTRSCSSRG